VPAFAASVREWADGAAMAGEISTVGNPPVVTIDDTIRLGFVMSGAGTLDDATLAQIKTLATGLVCVLTATCNLADPVVGGGEATPRSGGRRLQDSSVSVSVSAERSFLGVDAEQAGEIPEPACEAAVDASPLAGSGLTCDGSAVTALSASVQVRAIEGTASAQGGDNVDRAAVVSALNDVSSIVSDLATSYPAVAAGVSSTVTALPPPPSPEPPLVPPSPSPLLLSSPSPPPEPSLEGSMGQRQSDGDGDGDDAATIAAIVVPIVVVLAIVCAALLYRRRTSSRPKGVVTAKRRNTGDKLYPAGVESQPANPIEGHNVHVIARHSLEHSMPVTAGEVHVKLNVTEEPE